MAANYLKIVLLNTKAADSHHCHSAVFYVLLLTFNIFFYFAPSPDKRAEYGDQHVCVSLCL